ncbi:MAG: hypothetical protein ACI4XS_15490, partial [Bacillus sp. (in: firmicutes)]
MENKTGITTGSALLAVVLGLLILVFSQAVSALPSLLPIPESVVGIVFSVLYVAIAYFLLKSVCGKVIPISLKECRIDRIHISTKWVLVAVFLPVIVSAILVCLPGNLARNDLSGLQIFNIIVNAVFVVGFSAGVVEEMIFRGLIMTALEK